MFWAIVGFAVLALILLLGRGKPSDSTEKAKPAPTSRSRSSVEHVIGHQFDGKGYVPKTRAELDVLFAEEQGALVDFSRLAREAQKKASQFIDVPDAQLLEYRRVADAARKLSDGVQMKVDDIVFESDRGLERYYKLSEKFDDIEYEMTSAVEEILQNRKDREDADLPIPPKRVKRPAKS